MEEKLSLIVLDREKIEKNLFWKVLLERIKEQRNIALGELENGISLPIDKLRYQQGILAAWSLFRDLPDLIIENLRILEEETKG